MTQREKKARLKIRIADESIATAQVRLRDALIAGIDTKPIRAEIDALRIRIHEADAELAEIAACSYQYETQRRWDISSAILAMAVSNNESKLARLRPPAKTNLIEETKR
jgi:hypothetical protein